MRWEGRNHLHVQDHRDVADVDAGRVACGGRHLARELPPLGRVHIARCGAAAAIAPVACDLKERRREEACEVRGEERGERREERSGENRREM